MFSKVKENFSGHRHQVNKVKTSSKYFLNVFGFWSTMHRLIPTSFHLTYLVRLHKKEAGTTNSWYTDTPLAGVNIQIGFTHPSIPAGLSRDKKTNTPLVQHVKQTTKTTNPERTLQAVLGKGCYIKFLLFMVVFVSNMERLENCMMNRKTNP